MGKLSVPNENHNIRDIIINAQSWQTGMFVLEEETWMVATWVTETPFVLAFMAKL